MVKNIIVTGGAGFIGSHLSHRLIRDGHRVICIDNLQGGSERNINHLLAHPHFEFVKADVASPIRLAEMPELKRFSITGQGIQEIYHLACPTSPKDFLHTRKETLLANSAGVITMLEVAKEWNAKFLQASSAVVYGSREHQKEQWAREEEIGSVDFLSMRACYDEGKRFAETCAATYQELYRIDVKIARIFRTYGPRLPINMGHMIPDFVLAAFDRKPLVIFGDESFTTALLYIDDLIDGLLKLMDAPPATGPVNFGGAEPFRLIDVAKKVIELTDSSSSIEFHPPLLFMTPLSLPNIAKAERELGWMPLTTLGEGLKSTIQYTLSEKVVIG